jgi:protein TonB
MPRDLFGDVTHPSISIGNRKWYTLPLSLFSHSAIVAILIALPILAPAVMPSVFADDDMEYVTRLLPPPPPPPVIREFEMVKHPPISDGAPIEAPKGFAPEPVRMDQPVNDVPGIIGGSIEDASTALAPPPPPKPIPPVPVRVGGAVRTPVKVGGADPVYPAIAQAARVQGIVIIEATIGADGRIINARILRSVPLLDQAALEAVRSWEYTPTLLNGVPVPVIMTVTVSFTLSR